jgi:hypothetical protein
LFIIASAMATTNLSAETADNRTLSPYFYVENGDPDVDRFPLKQTDVKVNISSAGAYAPF